VLAVASLTLAPALFTAEPRNLGHAKREIRAYVESGEYAADIARVAAEAKAWIEERARVDARGIAGPQKLAAVFDLDETLWSNLSEMRTNDFGYLPESWRRWVRRGEARAIEPVREVYRAARAAGVRVFFVSARTERDRAGTMRNLRAIGCTDFEALRLLPNEAKESAAAFKTAERKRIADAGFVIIANIGDQESDLAGGFAERTFKLPNPFYLSE
jgi:Predicted secreted acid phosphatase